MQTELRVGTYCPTCGSFIDGGMITAFDGRPANTVLLEDFVNIEFACEHCGTVIAAMGYDSDNENINTVKYLS